MNNKLKVHKIFFSIQGESTWAGRPCVFVRLAGCPLRCTWCDTPEVRSILAGEDLELEEILRRIRNYAKPRGNFGVVVALTGGEPLSQKFSLELLSKVAETGYPTLLETSGAFSIENVPPRVKIVMDLKCPSSAMCDRNLLDNLELLRANDELKFVVANREDFDWALMMMQRHYLADSVEAILLSPAWGILDPMELAQWMMKYRPPARLQLQLHQVLGLKEGGDSGNPSII